MRRLCLAAAFALATTLTAVEVHATTDIELFFPVPVNGQLANEMQRVVDDFNKGHGDIHATATYTGSYDEQSLNTRPAIQGGRPPAVVLQSANYLRDYAINGEAISLNPLIEKD